MNHSNSSKDEDSVSAIDNKSVSIRLRVKKRILIASGQPGEDPENLPDDTTLEDMIPTKEAMETLADLLDELVKEYDEDARVRTREVEDCDTVKDCIEMVEGKIP